MRLLRGEHVLPIVHLEKRQWKSPKYGMQTRPHLQPIEWRTPGGGGPKLAPQSPPPQLIGPATAPTSTAPTSNGSASGSDSSISGTSSDSDASTPPASTVHDNTKPVKPVTVAELVADEIPWK